eukprot:3133198-Prymnesium_polylepis.1
MPVRGAAVGANPSGCVPHHPLRTFSEVSVVLLCVQIICICNDRGSQKVRSLANHCLDLRFRRPSPVETTTAMRRVVKDQGYNVDDATLNRIAQSCNADIRQTLNVLQMWRPEGAQQLSTADVNTRLQTTFKDVDVGPFDVADKFFTKPTEPLDNRLRNYFVDSGMTPLM